MANPKIQLACDIIQDEFEQTVKVSKHWGARREWNGRLTQKEENEDCVPGIDGENECNVG